MSYEVQVEELDAVRRRLKITVPAREVQEEIEGAVRELARSAKVPGFRPGRVPRGVLEKRFGDRLRADVNEKLMRSSLAEALEKEHIAPLSPPEILTTPDDDDGCLRYSATVEVKPVVEAHDYHGLELDRPLAPVEPAEIDAVLDRWRESQAPSTTPNPPSPMRCMRSKGPNVCSAIGGVCWGWSGPHTSSTIDPCWGKRLLYSAPT